jgi:hypothetical protein
MLSWKSLTQHACVVCPLWKRPFASSLTIAPRSTLFSSKPLVSFPPIVTLSPYPHHKSTFSLSFSTEMVLSTQLITFHSIVNFLVLRTFVIDDPKYGLESYMNWILLIRG